ncbi:MAG: hypothetical protein ACON5N_00900 [Akkermansiaceae bacterium]
MIKSLLPLLSGLILALPAQELDQATRDQLISDLMESRDAKAFEAAYQAGTKSGLPLQTLIEARFLFLVDEGTRASLAAYAPVLQKQLPNFKVDESTIFSTREDFQSIVEYTLALAALENNQPDLFKKHITEAFWLSPAQAGLFEPLITEIRLKQAMAKITLDLSEPIEDQKNPANKTSFQALMGDSKAILLHFWSPWIQQSIESMTPFSAVSKTLTEKKIPTASVLLTGTEDSRKDADHFLRESGVGIPGHWVVDRKKNSLVSLFRVQSFPVVVLLSKEGKVLFNGSPGDPVLWQELKKLDPSIEPPTLPESPQNLIVPDEDSSTDGGPE